MRFWDRILYWARRKRQPDAVVEDTKEQFLFVEVGRALDDLQPVCQCCGWRLQGVSMGMMRLGDVMLVWMKCVCGYENRVPVGLEYVTYFSSEKEWNRAANALREEPGNLVIQAHAVRMLWPNGKGGMCPLGELPDELLRQAYRTVQEISTGGRAEILITTPSGEEHTEDVQMLTEAIRGEMASRKDPIS